MFSLTVKRVGVGVYVAFLSGGIEKASYELQLRFAPPVVDSWNYAGVFVADNNGSVKTFELSIPSVEYKHELRFVSGSGEVSNVVIVEDVGNGGVVPSNGKGLTGWVVAVLAAGGVIGLVGLYEYIKRRRKR